MKDIYKNIHLYFEESGHKYTDSNGNEYISVTTIIETYAPKFKKKYWAHKKAKEYGIAEKEILKHWDNINKEARDRGNRQHNGLENAIKEVSKFKDAIQYLNVLETGRCITIFDIPSLNIKPLDIDEFKKATNYKYDEIYRVFDFYINKGYVIYSEIKVFDVELLISGTIDILCIKDSDFVILDWKTNRQGLQFESGYYKKDKSNFPEQLTNEWVSTNEKMLPPLNHLPECNGSHYSMQLSIYARLVERILEIPCTKLALCHIGSPFVLNKYGQPLHDEKGYHIDETKDEIINWYRINYLRNEADAVFNDRLLSLKAKTKQQDNQLNLFN